MTSTYTLTVQADSPEDAQDIAKRRARDDGYAVRTVRRVVRLAHLGPRAWSVELAVTR